MARCVVSFTGEGIAGVLSLTQQTEDAPTIFDGEITGLTPGKHGYVASQKRCAPPDTNARVTPTPPPIKHAVECVCLLM